MIPEGIGFERPSGGTHLDICPPSLQDKDFLATAERIPLRPVPHAEPDRFERPSRPLVYLTLGTAFGTPEVLTTVVRGLAALDAHVVVATGRVRPEDLGGVPDNVTVRAWVPQADVVAHADAVVHHGGSGTMLGALAEGVPQLVLPQGADQFANAEALCAAGAALRLLPGELSADAVTEQARKLPGHRDAARAIAAEIAAMPSPDEVARELPKYASPR
jgi:MGT family glycosyltransferase